MFNLIYPEQHNLYKPQIRSFLEKWTINSHTPFPLSERDKGAYIIAEHKALVFMGAPIYTERKLSFYPQKLSKS